MKENVPPEGSEESDLEIEDKLGLAAREFFLAEGGPLDLSLACLPLPFLPMIFF